nr:hypothetical transcript [Hymenolepis microstoma]
MDAKNVPVGVNRIEKDQAAFLNRIKNELEDSFNRPGKLVELNYFDIVRVCDVLKDIFSQNPLFLEVQSPAYVMGDIHGQFYDLLRIFRQIGHTDDRFIFLGDYVDRGTQSLEVVMYLFVLKALYPNKYFLLRGNHEDLDMCIKYGFENEMKHRLQDYTCFYDIIDVFNVMPISALIDGRVFCVHGGISEEFLIRDWGSIKIPFMPIPRPIDVSGFPFVRDLLWSDPIPEDKGPLDALFVPNTKRGRSIMAFGNSATERFFAKFNLKKILRGHEFCPMGAMFGDISRYFRVTSRIPQNNEESDMKKDGFVSNEAMQSTDLGVDAIFVQQNKSHWIPDNHCQECFECGKKFTTLTRRHHCRFCGRIFCSGCSSYLRDGSSIGISRPQRACSFCASNHEMSTSGKADDADEEDLVGPEQSKHDDPTHMSGTFLATSAYQFSSFHTEAENPPQRQHQSMDGAFRTWHPCHNFSRQPIKNFFPNVNDNFSTPHLFLPLVQNDFPSVSQFDE